ncbi:MAG: lipocalin family protein [Chthoniobacter sp.]
MQTHDFTGRIVSDGTNGRWKMRLLPLFTASYLIVDVAPDYSSAAVAHPSRKFGWILARDRSLPDPQYQRYLRVFARQEYDTALFKKVPQYAEGGRVSAEH